MSDTENNAAPKKAKRKKRKAAKAAKVVKTAKRAVVKRAKASTESMVEKPFNAVIRRKEREIRKLKEMSAKAKAMAGE